tara:strand:- start:5 stop:532 length:528 start_codon:yes stop_codon:yes gene_type:complete
MSKAISKIKNVNELGFGGGYSHFVEVTPSDLSTATGEEFLFLTLSSAYAAPALFAATVRRASITVMEPFGGGSVSDATIALGLGDGSTTNGGGASANGDALVEEVNCFTSDNTVGLEYTNTGADLDDAFGKVVAASGNGAVIGIATNGTGAGLGSATQGRAIIKLDLSNVPGGTA